MTNLGQSITPAPSPAFIGRGTTYTFVLRVSTPTLNYINENLRIRIKLNSDFSSDGPRCAIGDYNSLGLKNQYSQMVTSILPQTLN